MTNAAKRREERVRHGVLVLMFLVVNSEGKVRG